MKTPTAICIGTQETLDEPIKLYNFYNVPGFADGSTRTQSTLNAVMTSGIKVITINQKEK